ncbi:MAG: hypothetical protein IJW30_02700 [Clostridia bacterium]|nr:hypothetical protein [Clostridia bacterium]
MEVEKRSAEISVSVLWKVLLKRAWIILLVGIVVFGALATYSYVNYSKNKLYEATAEMYVRRPMTDDDVQNDNALVVADMTAVDCKEMLRKRAVLEAALIYSDMDDEMTWQELQKNVKVEIQDETHFISVTVTADDPEDACLLADMICRVGVQKIKAVMGEELARYSEELAPEQNDEPCNRPNLFLLGVIALAVMLVVYVVFVVIFIHNDYIGSQEELEKRLRVVVLGDVPDANRVGKKYGYYYVSSESGKGERK